MIISIGCSLPTFKEITFDTGLNIVLADRDVDSGETETRNGSGKSSLVDIIHFLLGSTPRKGSLFQVPELADATFHAHMIVDGIRLRVERSTRSDRRVTVFFVDGENHGLDLNRDLVEDPWATVGEWCRWLGRKMFRLPNPVDPRAPSFRELIGYSIRRREDVGFHDPHKYARGQSDGDAQVALSYLFGLDWKLASEFQDQREEKKEESALRRQAKARMGKGRLESAATLRSRVALAQSQTETLRSRVDNFVVHAQYQELASEAAAAKVQIEGLSREAVTVGSAVTHIRQSLVAEEGPDGRAVVALFNAAGVQLSDQVLKTFDEVKEFHESVIRNRRHHLDGQLTAQERRLAEINAETSRLGARRTEILSSLKGKGAFSDMSDAARQLALKQGELARLESQLEDALLLEKGGTERRDTENKLLARLQDDLTARETAVFNAVVAVDVARRALYASDRDGHLEIKATPSGPEFKITIDGSRSGGISSMEVFCFDYALSKITKDLHGGPRFLVHDSHLFDGVDARQVATAIELGETLADYIAGQYIVLLNSDEFDKLQFSEGFDARARVVPTVLNDTETGGLFGFRFK
jgi:uncharacterized protein YydD (DUF2326 family)